MVLFAVSSLLTSPLERVCCITLAGGDFAPFETLHPKTSRVTCYLV